MKKKTSKLTKLIKIKLKKNFKMGLTFKNVCCCVLLENGVAYVFLLLVE